MRFVEGAKIGKRAIAFHLLWTFPYFCAKFLIYEKSIDYTWSTALCFRS
jgi:hypothetical protein